MQTNQDLGVEVTVAFQNMKVGQVIFPPGIYRDHLVRCGFVKRIVAAKAADDRKPLRQKVLGLTR